MSNLAKINRLFSGFYDKNGVKIYDENKVKVYVNNTVYIGTVTSFNFRDIYSWQIRYLVNFAGDMKIDSLWFSPYVVNGAKSRYIEVVDE